MVLANIPRDNALRGFCRVWYSSAIRHIKQPAPAALNLADKGTATAVMPDHVLAGQWQHYRDRLPADTNFVMASDGFYSAFLNPDALWSWLTTHRLELERASF